MKNQMPRLTQAQNGLWLIDKLHPETSLYNIFCALRLRGPLDLRALRTAVEHVVARHEALRTCFPERDGRPEARVIDRSDVPLQVTDLTGAPMADRVTEALRLAQQWGEEPFDLGRGPLLRTRVVRLGPEDHLLSLALHHIVCDGRSMTVLFDELSVLYAQEIGTAHATPLPPPSAQFGDYADQLHANGAEYGYLSWWRSYLAGCTDVLALPTDRPRPAVRGTAGATRVFELPGPLIADVAELARRRRMTPFMILLAAYAALVGRLGGNDDVLIGVPVTDRQEPEFENLIGLFVDTLPIRFALSPGQSFQEMIEAARRSVLEVLSHSGISFDRIVEEVQPDRSPSHTPLVQVAFSADLNPFAQPRLAGLEVELITPEPTTAKFDLDMTINAAPDGGDGFIGVLTYSTELFDSASIDRFVERYVRLLSAALADPELTLCSLPLMEDRERTDILQDWAGVGSLPAAPPLVHEVFARQAALTPDAPAVSAGGQEVSYAELDALADRFAHHLRAAGAGPDNLVGVLQERGVDLVATLLGILKAGAAYLPLSPTHPPAYLAQLLATANSRYVVASSSLAHRLAGADAAVLTPGELRRSPHGPCPPPHATADHLASVLFTSGSTGEPKGVAITHRSVATLVPTMREMYHLTSADRVLQFASVGFDITVEELFPTWAAGACVVLAPEPSPAPDGMPELMTRERITFTILTSSYWRQWVTEARALGVHPAPSLRLLSIGAEPVDAETLRQWQRETGIPVFNAYGLTETTVNTTLVLLDDPFVGDRVPIGRPIDGVQTYVLDGELSPVPVGVPGELYAGGDCLARGYLGRADLTAARFVPHPFSARPGARLHRTGDRARWRPDGSLEVLGRLDDQLKFRGYRIEPGHVEAAMCSHPGVIAAAVVVRPGPGGQERLLGYVVPASGGEVPADLRDHLAGRLPAYLVPSVLTAIASVPLNANGKADPGALPDPVEREAAITPARTDLEQTLADIWQRLLLLPQVGVHDNFFERGGTSLALASLLAQINQALGGRLPLVALYEFPTIASLARHLAGDTPPDAAAEEHDRRTKRLRAGRERLTGRRTARS